MKSISYTLPCTIKFIYNNELHTIKVDPNPYDFVHDKIGCISPFNTMIPSITQYPINDASLANNWGTL